MALQREAGTAVKVADDVAMAKPSPFSRLVLSEINLIYSYGYVPVYSSTRHNLKITIIILLLKDKTSKSGLK